LFSAGCWGYDRLLSYVYLRIISALIVYLGELIGADCDARDYMIRGKNASGGAQHFVQHECSESTHMACHIHKVASGGLGDPDE
jgi:hypothetical protein